VPLPTAALAALTTPTTPTVTASAAPASAPASPAPAANTPLTGKDLLKRPANHQAHDDHMSDLVTNRERTIDEMKIQTMYKVTHMRGFHSSELW
jgi:hypothetical protein